MLSQALAFAPRVARTVSRVRTFASGGEFDVVVIGGGHAGCGTFATGCQFVCY